MIGLFRTTEEFNEKFPLEKGRYRVFTIKNDNPSKINVIDIIPSFENTNNLEYCAKQSVKCINYEDDRSGNHSYAFISYEQCLDFYKQFNKTV